MKKEDAIKYLQQIYPNGGHCWLDERRIEAIGMAVKALQEEPVSNPVDFEKELYKAFGQVKDFTLGMRIAKWFYDMGKNSQEPVSEDEIEKQFKAGDVVVYVSRHPAYSGLYLLGNPNDLSIGYSNANEPYQIALRNCTVASEDERKQFMRELDSNGYKWNEDILRIEKKEPVSEDLGEYINELSKQFPEVSFAKLSRIAVRVAKWQKEKDKADRAAVYKCGWNDRKAMMMKKSFDAKILPANIEETEFCLDDYEEVAIITEMVNKGEFKMGDKVKVIVIKED